MGLEVLTTTSHHVTSGPHTFRVIKTPAAKVTIELAKLPIGAITTEQATEYSIGLAKACALGRQLLNPPLTPR